MNTSLHNIETDDRGLLLACPQCGQRNRMAYARLGQTFRCGQCHEDLTPPSEPIEVKSDADFDAMVAQSTLPILVDFWAPWCNPCRMVAPEVAKIASANAGRWLVVKVNTQDLPSLAERFRISGIPTMAIFKGGREVARQSGAMPAAGIQQFMDRAAA